MIPIDFDRLNVPEDLQQRLNNATEELLAINDLQERKNYLNSPKSASLWGEVRPYLILLTGINETDAKCWYCESKGAGFTHHVDHFRPKNRLLNKNKPPEDGYWWLTFKVNNYRLACQRCNSGAGKQNQFPLEEGCTRAFSPDDELDDEIVLLLDPFRAADCTLLTFSEDGKVYPRYDENTFFGRKAKVSKEVYDLDHVAKVEARKQTWHKCVKLAARAQRALTQAAMAIELQTILTATERFEDTCEDIKKMVAKEAEFSAMAKFCFRSLGIDWLNELV